MAKAQGPAYTVNDVKVDIVAESSMKARDQAFAAAEVQAFKMLSARFLAPDQAASFVPPDAAAIAGMVSDFEITSEQLSKKRYLGTYVFRFKPGAVTRFFGHGPVNGDDAATGPEKNLLVLPLFSQNGQTSLWDTKKNPWLQAWQAQSKDDASALVIPTGDISDTMDIRETVADDVTQSGLKRMRARYGVDEIVILTALFDQTAKDFLKINVYRTDRGKVELVQTIPVPQGKASKLGELLSGTVPQMKELLKGGWKGQPMMSAGEQNADVYTHPVPEDENLDSQNTSAKTETQEQAPASVPQSGQVHVVSNFTNMADWLAIRRSLNDVPALQSLRILGLTTNQVSMEFIYSDWSALTHTLSSRDLVLQPTGPGEYSLTKIMPSTGYAR